MNGTVMALKQHFAHTGRIAEVTVDLEWWMSVEEVWIDAPFWELPCLGIAWQEAQQVADNGVGMVAVEHTCPEIDFPTQTPACCHVAALQQCVLGCFEEFAVLVW